MPYTESLRLKLGGCQIHHLSSDYAAVVPCVRNIRHNLHCKA